MSELKSKVDAKKMLDELLKATLSCYGCFGKSEEWSGVEVNEVKNELENASEKVNMNGSKTYVLSDQSEHEVSNEVVIKYNGSMIYGNLIDLESRYGNKVGVNEEGSNELAKIINQSIFSYPKPVTLIKYLLSLYYDYSREIHKKDFVVLDFFAGSGTTGQAVLELNKEDGGNRRFILCTNNENNICEEITYKRIEKVIKGYGDHIGIPANLKYYTTEYVKRYHLQYYFETKYIQTLLEN